MPNPVLWAKPRKFFTLLKDYKKGKRKRMCITDLMLPANPTLSIWSFGEKVCQPLMQTVSWVGGEVVSVSASKHCVGVDSFGSQYSSLLQRRRKSSLQIMGGEKFGFGLENLTWRLGDEVGKGYSKSKRNNLCKGIHEE